MPTSLSGQEVGWGPLERLGRFGALFPTQPRRSSPIIAITSTDPRHQMTLVLLLALAWLGLRTLLLLTQVQRHSPEARLGRAFEQELRKRGLISSPIDAARLMP